MTTLFLYDDLRARTFQPFALTRPVAEMMAGTALIRERWQHSLRTDAACFLSSAHLAAFDEPGAATAASGPIRAGSIIVNARCVPAFRTAAVPKGTSVWQCGDQVAAVRLRDAMDASLFAEGTVELERLHAGTGAIADIDGWWLDEVWDFIRLLADQLTSDIDRTTTGAGAPGHSTVIGGHAVRVAEDALIEPRVVFDASAGPIFVDSQAHVRAFTRLMGPCYIGPHANVLGGDISASSIGPVSKVRGELSNSVLLGHSNKGHDGFVGHSYLGRWVNLGAGTITSNLKNTYGTVSLWTPVGIRDTGMQFLGTMFGDHSKTGIGLRLTTGTVLGAGANVYGSAMPPKAVAPFSWGDGAPYDTYRIDKFIETAERVMSRRHIALTEQGRQHLATAHAGRWTVDGERRES